MKKLIALLIVAVTVIFAACEPFPQQNEPISISENLPEYSGKPYVEINNNIPSFTDKEKENTKSFEKYSRLDRLGRCGAAYANISTDLMPTEKRGNISGVHPTGWVQKSYAFVDDGKLYNRCHLIAHMLTGEDDNERNLITGTRYLNNKGMLPFETKVSDYIKNTENHVLYRVTPCFRDNNLVADGVQMEAWSVEDKGRGICFNVYCYNVQPGVLISYSNGKSKSDGTIRVSGKSKTSGSKSSAISSGKSSSTGETTYILNTYRMKFHKPDCSSVNQISPVNKKKFKGKRKELIKMGYEPCASCKP